MDSDYSVDGERAADSVSSDDEAMEASSPLCSPETPSGSPPLTPSHPGNVSGSPPLRDGSHSRSSRRSSSGDSNSQSPAGSPSSSSRGRRSPSGSPPARTPSGSPPARTPSRSPIARTPSGSPPARTPSGSPQRRTPSGSPQRRTPSGSPQRRTPSGSPQRRTPSGSPQRRTPSGSPQRRTPSGSPQRRTPSGSPPRRTPSGSPKRRTPSRSPPRHTPSRSPSRRTLSGSPPRHLVSGSPRQSSSKTSSRQSPLSSSKRSTSGASSRHTPTPSGSPPRRTLSSNLLRRTPSKSPRPTSRGSPSRRPPSSKSSGRSPSGSPPVRMGSGRSARRSGSPSRRSPPGSPRRWRYSHRVHGKRTKRRNGSSGRLSDGSDDGHSNISSSSSFAGSPDRLKEQSRMENGKPVERKKFEPHKAEDLSDVSDLDSAGDGSLDSLSDDEASRKKRGDVKRKDAASPVRITQCSSSLKDLVPQPDEMEQLDFEAEEPQAKEEGECGEAARRPESSNNDVKSEADDGEVKADEVEEGEITDEDENRPEETEPRPICRFYNRGQCTWGSSCRFLHPGVTDKGNYTMFDMVRPLVPANGPLYGPMIDYRAPMERPMLAPMGPMYGSARKEEPITESAWERGLRTAKEMMRKASKRKETDIDFEEKKMNLSLGQDELDKENDYYTRPASPALDDELDRWSDKEAHESKHHRVVVSDRYDPMDPYYAHHRESRERWTRGHYDDMRMPYGGEPAAYDARHQHMAYRAHMHHEYYPEKYDRKKKSHTVREVIVQHSRKPYKEEKSSSSAHKGRGDEWADPWMRSKSPTSRKSRPSRRQSYSSASSYSSSRSSRSYSSSYSRSASRSRSRSRSKSISRSVSISRSRSRSPGVRRPARVYRAGPGTGAGQRVRGGRPASPGPIAEKRIIHMNPPAPSPRNRRPPSPGAIRKTGSNPPPPPTAARGLERKVVGGKVRRSKSSRSSSSDSSGSSSGSSGTSLSSSSSSRDPTPPPKPKKIVMDERLLAQSTKVKAMDALKLSGQKQQIKLTLKTASAGSTDDPRRSAVIAGKKRVAESPPPEPVKTGISTKPPAKKTTSRREELLKQLKAVEDAIARKRSKIT